MKISMLINPVALNLNVSEKICLLFRSLKKNNLKILIVIFCLIDSAIIFTCREGIINPGNPIGNINEPVVYKSDNVYTFQIDAENVSFQKTDNTLLNITETDVYVTVTDYKGGTVHIKLIGESKQIIYQNLVANNISGKQASITNHLPVSISLLFQNFSGKLKIELSKTPFTF